MSNAGLTAFVRGDSVTGRSTRTICTARAACAIGPSVAVGQRAFARRASSAARVIRATTELALVEEVTGRLTIGFIVVRHDAGLAQVRLTGTEKLHAIFRAARALGRLPFIRRRLAGTTRRLAARTAAGVSCPSRSFRRTRSAARSIASCSARARDRSVAAFVRASGLAVIRTAARLATFRAGAAYGIVRARGHGTPGRDQQPDSGPRQHAARNNLNSRKLCHGGSILRPSLRCQDRLDGRPVRKKRGGRAREQSEPRSGKDLTRSGLSGFLRVPRPEPRRQLPRK